MPGQKANFQINRVKRMDLVDSMSPEIRAVVHEWGLSIVQALWDCGIRKPKHMQHIVNTIINETRAPKGFGYGGQRTGLNDAQRHARQESQGKYQP